MTAHAMFPTPNHDERARQDFVLDMRYFLGSRVAPGNRLVWEERGAKAFEKRHGRAAMSASDVAEVMRRDPQYQFWSALQRSNHEAIWDGVIDTVERDLPRLAAKATELHERARGTLTLDPNFELPRYLATHDIHLQPGNYQATYGDSDIAAGAIYERGAQIYSVGHFGGANDMLARTNLALYKTLFPSQKPRRVLDMGCGVGNAAAPWAEEFPGIENYGIDVGEALLRYAHARAEAMGVVAHFSQENAEATNFDDASFDVIVSHLLMHETSRKAVPAIFAECRRLLKPGGAMMHFDLPRFEGMEPVEAFLWSWEVENAGEYFSGTWRTMDIVAEARAAGWGETEVRIVETAPVLLRDFHPYGTPNKTYPVLVGVKEA